MVNPILVQSRRSGVIENIHRGAFCLFDSRGKVKIALGDISSLVFPHSAIKSMQALAMFKSGAVERFGLDERDIAIACASHNGEEVHIKAVERLLAKVGCEVEDLECGSHVPFGTGARRAFFAMGAKLSPIYNACSGKHAGMLAVARALDVPIKGYSERGHAVQKLVRLCVEEMIGQDLSEQGCGIDGCSIPTWAAPLSAFALGFGKMISGEGLAGETREGAKQIFTANVSEANLIRGANTLDSDLMVAFDKRLLIKNGSDGVYCGALIENDFLSGGFALKIDDGNLQAAEVGIANILLAIAKPNEKERIALERYSYSTLKNWRKIEVGEIAGADDLKLDFS